MDKVKILEMLLKIIYSTDTRNIGGESSEFWVMDRDDLVREIEREIQTEKKASKTKDLTFEDSGES